GDVVLGARKPHRLIDRKTLGQKAATTGLPFDFRPAPNEHIARIHRASCRRVLCGRAPVASLDANEDAAGSLYGVLDGESFRRGTDALSVRVPRAPSAA